MRVLHWICGVKRKPKAVNKPLHYFIVHGLDKPGSSATVSKKGRFLHALPQQMPQGAVGLPDHLGGLEEEQWGDRDPEGLGGLEVDDEIELHRFPRIEW